VPAGYTLVSDFGSTTLASGESTTFTVRLDADAPGTYAGEVSFGTNDADEIPFCFNLAGEVLPVLILDNGDPGYAESGSGWGDATYSLALAYGQDYRRAYMPGGSRFRGHSPIMAR